MPVASAEAPILAMLLPSSSAPIKRSRSTIRSDTTSASRLPCFDKRSMLEREAPVSAVSLAAKNAEALSSANMMENVSQSMTRPSVPARELCLEKIAHPRRLDILCDHGAADCLKQNESQPPTSHLFVLCHQIHQRVGIREPFLRKSRYILQMGRQPHLGKVTFHANCVTLRDHAKRGGKFRRQHHADRHALAMEQAVGETGRRLQRVTERMAEIEQRPLAGFALIARDNRGVGAA